MTANATASESFSLTDVLKACEDLITAKPSPFDGLLMSKAGLADLSRRAFAMGGTIADTARDLHVAEFMGVRVYTGPVPKQTVYDWSGCRSPSRAKRRHAQGHPQRVRITEHEVAYLFDQRVLSDLTGRYDRMAVKALFGASGTKNPGEDRSQPGFRS